MTRQIGGYVGQVWVYVTEDLPAVLGTGSMRVIVGLQDRRPESSPVRYTKLCGRGYLSAVRGAAAIPDLNRRDLHTLPVRCHGSADPEDIAHAVAQALDDLIENNQRRVEVLEEMARAIYREWFMKFRYPGHGDVRMVDSVLGPIPDGVERGEARDYR